MGDAQDDLNGLGRILCTVDKNAIALVVCYKPRQIFIQTIDHIRPDGVGAPAPLTPIGDGLECNQASLQAPFGIVV